MKYPNPKARVVRATIALALAAAATASAQIPPHQPGTVCVANDRSLWCWTSPGPVMSPCACQTPFGAVPGTRQ